MMLLRGEKGGEEEGGCVVVVFLCCCCCVDDDDMMMMMERYSLWEMTTGKGYQIITIYMYRYKKHHDNNREAFQRHTQKGFDFISLLCQ